MSATDFNKIWQVGANWPITTYWALKFRIFEKQGWQRPPYWKFEKLLISAMASQHMRIPKQPVLLQYQCYVIYT